MLTKFTARRQELKEGFEGFKNENVMCEKRQKELEVSHGIRMNTFSSKRCI
jgi:hypothetical protein